MHILYVTVAIAVRIDFTYVSEWCGRDYLPLEMLLSRCQLLVTFTLFIATLTVVAEAEKCRDEVSCKRKRSSESPYQCYDDIDDPYVYFATKTAYRWNRNKDDDEIRHEGMNLQDFIVFSFLFFVCQDILSWLLNVLF